MSSGTTKIKVVRNKGNPATGANVLSEKELQRLLMNYGPSGVPTVVSSISTYGVGSVYYNGTAAKMAKPVIFDKSTGYPMANGVDAPVHPSHKPTKADDLSNDYQALNAIVNQSDWANAALLSGMIVGRAHNLIAERDYLWSLLEYTASNDNRVTIVMPPTQAVIPVEADTEKIDALRDQVNKLSHDLTTQSLELAKVRQERDGLASSLEAVLGRKAK